MLMSWLGSTALADADRGADRMSAISPKCSPGAISESVCPAWTMWTSPSSTTKS